MGKFLKKVFLAFLILGLVVVLLPIAVGAGVVALAYSTGTVTVDVDDGQGTDFTLPLPAGLIPMALRFLPGTNNATTSRRYMERVRNISHNVFRTNQ